MSASRAHLTCAEGRETHSTRHAGFRVRLTRHLFQEVLLDPGPRRILNEFFHRCQHWICCLHHRMALSTLCKPVTHWPVSITKPYLCPYFLKNTHPTVTLSLSPFHRQEPHRAIRKGAAWGQAGLTDRARVCRARRNLLGDRNALQ